MNHGEPVFPVPAPGLGFPVVVEELLLVLMASPLHLLLNTPPHTRETERGSPPAKTV